jgi:predicted aldo/keto reductase-like oxidoreductase
LTLNEDIIKSFVKLREKGMTRFIGVSTHSNQAEVMDAAIESGVWEAVLTGYNYHSPKEVGESIKRTREAGLATIGMKNLITTARPRRPFPDIRGENEKNITNQQALIAWVLENKYLDTTIPGMTSFEQLADDIAVMGMKLGFNGRKSIRRYSMGTAGEYCSGVSGCTGCRDKCPNGVAVNEINRCVNYADGYGSRELAKENYENLPVSSQIDKCDDCEECDVKCINGLNLTRRIERARELFA